MSGFFTVSEKWINIYLIVKGFKIGTSFASISGYKSNKKDGRSI
jgi:hypothetical protein